MNAPITHPGLGCPVAGPFPFIDRLNATHGHQYVFPGIGNRVEFLYALDVEGKQWREDLEHAPIYNLRSFLEKPQDVVFLCQTPYLADKVEKTGRLAVALPVNDPLAYDMSIFHGRSVVIVHHHHEDPVNDWSYDCQDALADASAGSVRSVKRFWGAPEYHTLFDEEDPESILKDAEISKQIRLPDPDLEELDGNSYKQAYTPLETFLSAPEEGRILLPNKGFGVVAADGGVGKSFLGHRLCLASAFNAAGINIKVMGQEIHQGGLGIYLTAEDNITTVDDNTDQMLERTKLTEEERHAGLRNFIRKPYGSLSAVPELIAFDARTKTVRQLPEFTKLRRQMHRLVEKRGMPIRVIVFDNASQMLSVDSDKQFEVVKAMRALSSLANEFECLVILLAHTRKSTGSGYGEPKAAADAVMGSVGWKTGVRFMLVMYQQALGTDTKASTIESIVGPDVQPEDVMMQAMLVKSNLGKRMFINRPLTLLRRMGQSDFVYIAEDELTGIGVRNQNKLRKRILKEIERAYLEGRPHTATSFEKKKFETGEASIKDEVLAKMGQKKLREELKELREQNLVISTPDGKGLYCPTIKELMAQADEEQED